MKRALIPRARHAVALSLLLSPLLPLSVLLFTGLYLFALPYTVKWRRRAG